MIMGIVGNICVLFMVNDVYMWEYSIVILKDCIVFNNDEDNDFVLIMMENVFFVEIIIEK